MWELYPLSVQVKADCPNDAEQKAIRKLATGVFKDRGYGAWIVEKVEVIK